MRQENFEHSNEIRNKAKENKKSVKGCQRQKRDNFIVDTLRVPMDVYTGEARVTMMGSHRVWIENYKGILEYTDCCILLQSKNCQIRVEGNHLCMEYYTSSDLLVRGTITGVYFVR